MSGNSAFRQAAVRMHPRRDGRSVSRPSKPQRRITIVTRISSTGMLPKHANGKVSDIDLFSETSMPFGKIFFRGRSQFAHESTYAAPQADAAPGQESRILRVQFGARQIDLGQTSSRQASAGRPQCVSSKARPLRAIWTAGSGLMLKATAWCGECADLAFANFPVGVLSWIVTQIFVGCAAYAEAMYPTAAYAFQNEDADRRDPLPGRPPERGGSSRSPGLAPDLGELSRFAIDGGGKRLQFPVAGQTQSNAVKPGDTEKVVWLNAMRRPPSGPLVSITLIVAAWLSRRRRPRGGRRATAELRHYDRRALRGVGPLR
jgi:hypothetical protein